MSATRCARSRPVSVHTCVKGDPPSVGPGPILAPSTTPGTQPTGTTPSSPATHPEADPSAHPTKQSRRLGRCCTTTRPRHSRSRVCRRSRCCLPWRSSSAASSALAFFPPALPARPGIPAPGRALLFAVVGPICGISPIRADRVRYQHKTRFSVRHRLCASLVDANGGAQSPQHAYSGPPDLDGGNGMPSTRKRRGVALGAFALASTTTLAAVAAASPAVAASSSATRPRRTTPAQAQGNALGLSIDLPVKLPLLPNPLSLNLIHLDGKTVHDPLHLAGTTSAVSNATASLITGSLVDALQNTLHVNLSRTAQVHSAVWRTRRPRCSTSRRSRSRTCRSATWSPTSSRPPTRRAPVRTSIHANIASGNDLLGAQTVSQVQNLVSSTHLTTTLQGTVNQVLSTLQKVTSNAPRRGRRGRHCDQHGQRGAGQGDQPGRQPRHHAAGQH